MNPKKTFTFKDLSDEEKPREKLIFQGKKSLTNAELIAILLRSGMAGKNVLELAHEVLLSANNSLSTLSQMEFKDLRAIKSLGDAKITTLIAALELGWRMQGEISNTNFLVADSSTTLFQYLTPALATLDHEEFWAVFMNNSRRILGRQRISVGGQTDTSVDLRILFRAALDCKATALAVAHNHPSGSLQPSSADISLTNQIKNAGNLLAIKLVDHLIIAIEPNGRLNYFSFHDNGRL